MRCVSDVAPLLMRFGRRGGIVQTDTDNRIILLANNAPQLYDKRVAATHMYAMDYLKYIALIAAGA